jgi:hypothetical protein
VAQKRIDYGFVGYQVPTKPRATRSPRVNEFCFAYGADYYYLFIFMINKTIHVTTFFNDFS